MNPPQYFESIEDNYAVFRPQGQVTLQAGVAQVTAAIAFAREQKIRRLLVDTLALSGFEPPTVFARYAYAEEWALAARGAVRLAIVARPEMIDSEKIAVMVGINRGLTNDVFTSEAEALAWLMSNRPSTAQ